MSLPPVRLIKVGGSLIDVSDLGLRIRDWISHHPPARNVIIFGGGEFADLIRARQERLRLTDTVCHWLCIDLLHVTARLGIQILTPHLPCEFFQSWQALIHSLETGNQVIRIIAPGEFVRFVAPQLPPPRLTEGWQVTSDSIAAQAARALSAAELVIFKSTDAPMDSLQQLAELGYVDQAFPAIAAEIEQVRFINLRCINSARI